MSGLFWVQTIWKGYQQMTKSCKGLTQSLNTSVQLQIVITSKVSNSLDPDQVRTECWAWSESKMFETLISRCHLLKVMLRFNAKIKYWFNSNLSKALKCQTVWTPFRSGQNVRPDLGQNCLKGLSTDDNVMFKFKTKLKYIGSTSTCHNL